MRITTIVDNTASGDMWAEHGQAILIEKDGRSILFDTGQTPEVLRYNMGNLGIAPEEIDTVVLSHGHYDHTGGLPWLVRANHDLEIYGHPDMFAEKYAKKGTEQRYIGISERSEEITGRFHAVIEPREVAKEITVLGEIPVKNKEEWENGHKGMLLKKNGEFVPDPLKDDTALIIDLGEGLGLITGCSHSGITNIIEYAEHVGGKDVILVIGGMHLSSAPLSLINRTVDYMKDRKFMVMPGHCTGFNAMNIMKNGLRYRMRPNFAGNTLTPH